MEAGRTASGCTTSELAWDAALLSPTRTKAPRADALAASGGALGTRDAAGAYEPAPASEALGSSSPAVSGLAGERRAAVISAALTFSGWWQAAMWPLG